jgi:cytidine deaminase
MSNRLFEAAYEARKHAYAPYSNYEVGAAVMTADGEIYSGCNVENASYGLTSCAERNAIFAAVAAGQTDIARVVISIDGPSGGPCGGPCGACRQVMKEFMKGYGIVEVYSGTELINSYTVDRLLPDAFEL